MCYCSTVPISYDKHTLVIWNKRQYNKKRQLLRGSVRARTHNGSCCNFQFIPVSRGISSALVLYFKVTVRRLPAPIFYLAIFSATTLKNTHCVTKQGKRKAFQIRELLANDVISRSYVKFVTRCAADRPTTKGRKFWKRKQSWVIWSRDHWNPQWHPQYPVCFSPGISCCLRKTIFFFRTKTFINSGYRKFKKKKIVNV